MLEVEHLYKQYEGKPLLCDLSLQVQPGETVCLLGASGSGKSTLLRMVAGIEFPESGDIRWDGDSVLPLPIHLRHFGLMFQDYALFPHLNVFGNVAYGLKIQHVSGEELQQRVREALEQVGMAGFESRQVSDLSGGEQQRVALARTLAARPRLLMLDEPLAALDRGLRRQLLTEIRSILHETGIPAIYVTHDQEEAYLIADRVMLLADGKIIQSGTPAEVYEHPASLAVAQFLGMRNLLPGTVMDGDPLRVQTGLGIFTVQPGVDVCAGDRVTLLLRKSILSEHVNDVNRISARVLDASFQEDGYLLSLQSGGSLFQFMIPGYRPGADQVQFSIPPQSLQIFKEETHA